MNMISTASGRAVPSCRKPAVAEIAAPMVKVAQPMTYEIEPARPGSTFIAAAWVLGPTRPNEPSVT